MAYSLLAAAIDRVHRIGQEKAVYVKHFVVCDKAFWSFVDADCLLGCPNYRESDFTDSEAKNRHRQ